MLSRKGPKGKYLFPYIIIYTTSYAAIVFVTAVKPLNTNDAARVVPPTTVSEIVPLLSVISEPPIVKTSVTDRL
jgi:hypothetical protein